MKLVLNSIVKNEEQTLPRMIDSVSGLVSDYIIVDTGSEDNTPDILSSKEIKVHQRKFDNFESSRTHALHLAINSIPESERDTTYILLLDADMVLKVENQAMLLKTLEQENPDIVLIYQKAGGLLYKNVRMVRASLANIRYIGVTHEYLSYPDGSKLFDIPESITWIDDCCDGGSRHEKLARDRRLLENTEQNVRTLFYLAQTYRDMKLYDLAVETYKKRIDVGGWIEEIIYSRYVLIKLYLEVFKDINSAVIQAQIIQESERPRPEPFYLLCTYFRSINNIPEAVKYLTAAQLSICTVQDNIPLFYETSIEELIAFEEYLLWYHMHPKFRGQVKELADQLMTSTTLPPEHKECVQSNYSKFYQQYTN